MALASLAEQLKFGEDTNCCADIKQMSGNFCRTAEIKKKCEGRAIGSP